MLTAADRAALWAEMTPEERQGMIEDHVELFVGHVLHRRAERIRARHRRGHAGRAFPVGDPLPLPQEVRPTSWAARVYAVLAEAEEWLTRNEIAERLGDPTARNWHSGLKVLTEQGLIVEGPAQKHGYRTRQTVALRRRHTASRRIRSCDE